MIILTLRTDNPEAELGLYSQNRELTYQRWPAHKLLAETLHDRVLTSLKREKKDWPDLTGIVVFLGPGSFTGLRIGLSVCNALAASLEIPIVGTSGEDWKAEGLERLMDGENDGVVLPDYGSPPHTTQQKK